MSAIRHPLCVCCGERLPSGVMDERAWDVVGTVGAVGVVGGMGLAAVGTPIAGVFFVGGLFAVIIALVGRQAARRREFYRAEQEAARRHAALDAQERRRRRAS